MNKDIYYFLKWTPFARDFSKEELEFLSDYFQEARYSTGEKVFTSGTSGIGMGIIIDGEARVIVSGKELAVIEKGESVGELALIDDSPRAADVIAGNRLILVLISKAKFYEIIETKPALGCKIVLYIARILSARIRSSNLSLQKKYWSGK